MSSFIFAILSTTLLINQNMQPITTLALVAAAIISVASAENCNPSYDVARSTDCFENCNVVNWPPAKPLNVTS